MRSKHTHTRAYENDDGEEIEASLPATHDVCPTCEGHGTHLTPSIRDHAYTREEFNEAFDDEEDRSEYFRHGGRYDVVCEECKGKSMCFNGMLMVVFASFRRTLPRLVVPVF